MIEKYLDLSTGHVSEQTANWLDTKPNGIVMYNTEYGWIVYSGYEDLDEYPEIPADLVRIIKYAKEHECRWVMFDCDGEVIEGLTKYNW